MKTIIVGHGEVGSGMREVLERAHEVAVCDPTQDRIPELGQVCDVMVVALPWNEHFLGFTKLYQKIWNPRFTVILSTVPVGISKQLGAWHCPIEGIHPRLAEGITLHRRWLGGPHNPELIGYFESAGLKVKSVPTSDETEFLKLRSTTLYGVNIEFARYSGKVCEQMGFDYAHVNEWDADYNALYEQLGLPQMKRYLLKPPQGKIGGHCIYPNAQILQSQFPDDLVDVIVKRNTAEAEDEARANHRPYDAGEKR